MPHIQMKCYPGKTEEQKIKLAEKIAAAVEEVFGSKNGSISVTIEDVEPQQWKEEVWDKEIVPKKEILYKKPEYTMD